MKDAGGSYSAQPITGEGLDRYQKRIAELRTQNFGDEGNGLQFCLTLASTSGATVRAARLVQAEDNGDLYWSDGSVTQLHPIMRDFDRFGDWEGPVWDFMPNGSVKYLGCNLPRARLRFPTQQVGPQLTYNFREQGGQDPETGQRPQRMNRSPLPV